MAADALPPDPDLLAALASVLASRPLPPASGAVCCCHTSAACPTSTIAV